MKDKIAAKLTQAFQPKHILVHDDSATHAGHTNAPEGGNSHFTVILVSKKFENQSRVTRHRAVYEVLGKEFEQGLHALALQLLTPEEWEKKQKS